MFLALEEWKATDAHLYFAIKTQLVLGIRVSELRALTKDDLDQRTPGIWIRRPQARKVVSTPKSKKARFEVPRALATSWTRGRARPAICSFLPRLASRCQTTFRIGSTPGWLTKRTYGALQATAHATPPAPATPSSAPARK